jgi:hypothetical protein
VIFVEGRVKGGDREWVIAHQSSILFTTFS